MHGRPLLQKRLGQRQKFLDACSQRPLRSPLIPIVYKRFNYNSHSATPIVDSMRPDVRGSNVAPKWSVFVGNREPRLTINLADVIYSLPFTQWAAGESAQLRLFRFWVSTSFESFWRTGNATVLQLNQPQVILLRTWPSTTLPHSSNTVLSPLTNATSKVWNFFRFVTSVKSDVVGTDSIRRQHVQTFLSWTLLNKIRLFAGWSDALRQFDNCYDIRYHLQRNARRYRVGARVPSYRNWMAAPGGTTYHQPRSTWVNRAGFGTMLRSSEFSYNLPPALFHAMPSNLVNTNFWLATFRPNKVTDNSFGLSALGTQPLSTKKRYLKYSLTLINSQPLIQSQRLQRFRQDQTTFNSQRYVPKSLNLKISWLSKASSYSCSHSLKFSNARLSSYWNRGNQLHTRITRGRAHPLKRLSAIFYTKWANLITNIRTEEFKRIGNLINILHLDKSSNTDKTAEVVKYGKYGQSTKPGLFSTADEFSTTPKKKISSLRVRRVVNHLLIALLRRIRFRVRQATRQLRLRFLMRLRSEISPTFVNPHLLSPVDKSSRRHLKELLNRTRLEYVKKFVPSSQSLESASSSNDAKLGLRRTFRNQLSENHSALTALFKSYSELTLRSEPSPYVPQRLIDYSHGLKYSSLRQRLTQLRELISEMLLGTNLNLSSRGELESKSMKLLSFLYKKTLKEHSRATRDSRLSGNANVRSQRVQLRKFHHIVFYKTVKSFLLKRFAQSPLSLSSAAEAPIGVVTPLAKNILSYQLLRHKLLVEKLWFDSLGRNSRKKILRIDRLRHSHSSTNTRNLRALGQYRPYRIRRFLISLKHSSVKSSFIFLMSRGVELTKDTAPYRPKGGVLHKFSTKRRLTRNSLTSRGVTNDLRRSHFRTSKHTKGPSKSSVRFSRIPRQRAEWSTTRPAFRRMYRSKLKKAKPYLSTPSGKAAENINVLDGKRLKRALAQSKSSAIRYSRIRALTVRSRIVSDYYSAFVPSHRHPLRSPNTPIPEELPLASSRSVWSDLHQSKKLIGNIFFFAKLITNPLMLKYVLYKTNSNFKVKSPSSLKLSNSFSVSLHNDATSLFFGDRHFHDKYSNSQAAIKLTTRVKRRIYYRLTSMTLRANVLFWKYQLLTGFMESCTGRKITFRINTVLEESLSFQDVAQCSIWSPRVYGFKRMLGPRIFTVEAISLVCLALRLKDPTFLANWIRGMMKRLSFWKSRLIFRYLRYLIRYLFMFYFKDLQFRGIKIQLKGKIGVAGNARTRTLFFAYGETSHAKMDHKVAYDLSFVETFTGVMGFKVWFFY